VGSHTFKEDITKTIGVPYVCRVCAFLARTSSSIGYLFGHLTLINQSSCLMTEVRNAALPPDMDFSSFEGEVSGEAHKMEGSRCSLAGLVVREDLQPSRF